MIIYEPVHCSGNISRRLSRVVVDYSREDNSEGWVTVWKMCNNTNHCSYPIAAPVLLRVVGVWSLRSLVTSVLFWGPKWPKDRSGCSLGLFYLLYRLENNLRALNTAAAKGPPIHYSSSVLVLRWLCQCPSKALHYFAYRRLIQSRGNFFNVTPARHGRRLTFS